MCVDWSLATDHQISLTPVKGLPGGEEKSWNMLSAVPAEECADGGGI